MTIKMVCLLHFLQLIFTTNYDKISPCSWSDLCKYSIFKQSVPPYSNESLPMYFRDNSTLAAKCCQRLFTNCQNLLLLATQGSSLRMLKVFMPKASSHTRHISQSDPARSIPRAIRTCALHMSFCSIYYSSMPQRKPQFMGLWQNYISSSFCKLQYSKYMQIKTIQS